MSRTLTPPSAGQPIRASFFAELLREVRANRPLPGKNTRTKRTPNGTYVSTDVPEAQKSQPKLPGCWEMKLEKNEEESEEPTYTATFENRYYSVGGRTYEATEETTLEDLTGTEIIAVKISADAETTQPTMELTSYAGLVEMQGDQGDEYVYVIPLYKIEGGKVTCDFRLGRVSAMWEFPS